MTLPASGQISMSQMNTELGRSSTAQLSASDAALNGLVPQTAGTQLSFSELHGKSFDTISIADYNNPGEYDSGPATVGYSLRSDGTISSENQGGDAVIGSWLTPGVNMANYEAYATLLSGSSPGTMDTWLNLGTTRTWSLSRLSMATGTSTFALYIRRASDGSVLDSATITISISRVA